MNHAVPHVLIVDDHPDMLGVLDQLMKSAGYETELANSGVDALERAHTDTPDLILLDWMMPGMDGLQVLAHLRAAPMTAKTPVVVISAKGPEEGNKAIRAGATAYWPKGSVDAEELIRIADVVTSNRVHGKILRADIPGKQRP
ncbi:MAG: response regulator [Burkholderiales bacterium]|nr:response regulator [Phycisphaerae bacterium]